MPSQYQVNVAQLNQAGGQVSSTAQALTANADTMMRHLQELHSSWHGQAAATFAELMTAWRKTQILVESSLQDIHRAIVQVAASYDEAESFAVRSFVPR